MLIQYRISPKATVQDSQTLEAFGNAVDTISIKTAAKFSAKFLHVFKDDKSLAAAVIFPIGVIALHRWAFHMVHHEMVEARLYCTDIDLVMQARKIRLDAKLFRDAGIFADSLQRNRDKHLRSEETTSELQSHMRI